MGTNIWKLSMPPFKKSMTTALYPEPLPVCKGGGEGGRTPPAIGLPMVLNSGVKIMAF